MSETQNTTKNSETNSKNNPKIIIYTTSHCPYCVSAKNLFRNMKMDFEEISLDENDELRQKLSKENNGWRTVPMIFIDGKFVGGFDDVKKLYSKSSE